MDKEIVEFIKYGAWILFGSGVLFEISPIKFNPISSFLNFLGEKLNKTVEEKIVQLDKKVDKVQSDFQSHKIESQRRNILNFADKLMKGEGKTKEDFESIIKIHDDYDSYIIANKITNGQIDLAYDFISKKYQECRSSNSFYTGK